MGRIRKKEALVKSSRAYRVKGMRLFLEEAAGFESKGGSESVTLSNTSVERIEGNSCRARLIAVQRDPAVRVFAPQQQNEKQSNEQ